MSSFIKKYPRAKISRHATLDGWVIDLIQRETAKPKRVAATYASITWAHRAAHVKLGLPVPAMKPSNEARVEAPVQPTPAPRPAKAPDLRDHGTCKPCNRRMRPAGTKIADYPGTVLRQRDGLCQSCYQREKKDEAKKSRPSAGTVAEDVEFLATTGASREEIADRLGSSWNTLARRLYRMGREDLILLAKPTDPDKAEGARKANAA